MSYWRWLYNKFMKGLRENWIFILLLTVDFALIFGSLGVALYINRMFVLLTIASFILFPISIIVYFQYEDYLAEIERNKRELDEQGY